MVPGQQRLTAGGVELDGLQQHATLLAVDVHPSVRAEGILARVGRADVENAVQKLRKDNKPSGPNDAAVLLEILQQLEQDDGWKYAFQLDSQKRLKTVVFMSHLQINSYRKFNDVLLQDNTNKTNRF